MTPTTHSQSPHRPGSRYSDLPPTCQWLVRTMSAIGFGRIESLTVRGGQPVLDPPPRIFRDVKLGSGNLSDTEVPSCDFVVKQKVQELLELIQAIGDGEVATVEVRGGVPFRAVVSEDPTYLGGRAW